MFHRGLAVAAAAVYLQCSPALAGDVVTLRCDFPEQGKVHAHYSDVVADAKGISITDYSTNKDTGKLEYVKIYDENEKKENREAYYRINRAEIAWGSTSNIFGLIMILSSSIDLRSGIEKDDVKMISKGKIDESPTQTGHCKPN